ncbi:WD40/YVTN/BNR-like repeat-containing protein [Natrononativus amylolyticus]|uniref:WD40/YVTN/BNR-like repeat-containing protein n=1 Tax=Natrononativus amylolyticus TaxID=2963434 RepID=UPI0020CC8BCF|nr:hypothetical protein [Natrononativus amylolyticus]
METSSTATGRELGDAEGVVDFVRRYSRTWIHGVSTAGLTGFGMLTFVHRWFAALAIASYVLPPVGLYLAHGGPTTGASPNPAAESSDESTTPPETSDHTRAPTTSSAERRGTPPGPADTAGRAAETDDDRLTGGESSGTDEDTLPTREPRWTGAEAPTAAPLFGAALARGGAVAVGGDGVVVASGDEGWTTVLEDGPGANAETLYGVDPTADGKIVWMAGDNGAVGRLEVDTGRHVDHSAPNDLTDNLTGVAVSGIEGDETVLVINGSGEVLRGRYRDGDLVWGEPVKPGSGSSLTDVAFAGEVGYCCDTNDGVFRSEDGGRTFERVGLEGADGTLTALAPAAPDDCLVATDAGVVHRYDGDAWTPERVGEAALTGVARDDGGVAVCDDAGGIAERRGPAADWERIATSAPGLLRGIALEGGRGLVVGDEGTVLEQR